MSLLDVFMFSSCNRRFPMLPPVAITTGPSGFISGLTGFAQCRLHPAVATKEGRQFPVCRSYQADAHSGIGMNDVAVFVGPCDFSELQYPTI
jgi:hypothetical protein